MEVRWQYRRLKYDENEKTDMGGKKLIFVFYACGDGGWRLADAALGVKPKEFLCRNFLYWSIFCPIFWDKKMRCILCRIG